MPKQYEAMRDKFIRAGKKHQPKRLAKFKLKLGVQ